MNSFSRGSLGNNNMVIIGIVGHKNVGKDTIADFLVDRYAFHKEAFASPVKAICRVMFLLGQDQLDDHVVKEVVDQRWGMSPRQMFQSFGTDYVRENLGDDFWVRHMDLRLKEMLDNKKDIVISDVRFPNEADWVKKKGGVLIRVTDPSVIVSTDTHSSETNHSTISVDHTIVNDKTKGYEPLMASIQAIVEKMVDKAYTFQRVVGGVHAGWMPFLLEHKAEVADILDHVDKEHKRRTVYPPPELVFHSLFYFPPEETKVVVLGQDPYIGCEGDVPQACGLSFSVPSCHKHLPPSLQNIFKELRQCFPDGKAPQDGSLLRWVVDEKVLLLNASLTVRKGESNSHEEYWSTFTDELIGFLSQRSKDVAFLLMGKFAAQKNVLIDQRKHKVFVTVHPSPLSASRGFFGCRVFSKINEYLQSRGRLPVRWLI